MAKQDIQRRIRIDERLGSYKEFFDHSKGRRLDETVRGTKLDKPAFDLGTSWKAASNTLRLPWLTVLATERFGRNFAKDHGFAPQFTMLLEQQLPERMKTALKPVQQLALHSAVNEIREKAQSLNKSAKRIIRAELHWQSYLEPSEDGSRKEFCLAIWGSQRIGYSAVYHAYENFLRQCMVIATGNAKYRFGKIQTLIADVRTHFGPAVVDACVTDDRVNSARLVRHALAHNGGIVTSELRGKDHGIELVDDELQIMAPDNQRLMSLLQDCVQTLATRALALPQFQ